MYYTFPIEIKACAMKSLQYLKTTGMLIAVIVIFEQTCYYRLQYILILDEVKSSSYFTLFIHLTIHFLNSCKY